MPFGTLRMDGTHRQAVYGALLVALPLLDVSQVTYQDPVDVTGAVSDDPELADEDWRSPAEHAQEVMEALGGPVALEAKDKRAFGRLLDEQTEPVDVAHEVNEVPQSDF